MTCIFCTAYCHCLMCVCVHVSDLTDPSSPPVSLCLLARYSGYWITTRQQKESVCLAPPSTATTCCTARSRNWSRSTPPRSANSSARSSWGCGRAAWERGERPRDTHTRMLVLYTQNGVDTYTRQAPTATNTGLLMSVW